MLSDIELAAILKAADRQGWPFGPVVNLLTLTAQRRGEVVGMAWEEVDLKAKLWTIPGERTKNHRPHVVPLTDTAVAIVEALPRVEGSPLVFPARGYLDRAYSGYSKGKRELDALAEQHDWTLHDLRRTAATGMARAGVPPHVVERLLNHVPGTFGGVAGVYNRFGYLDEMRAALAAWERHVVGLAGQAATATEQAAARQPRQLDKVRVNSSIMNDDDFEWDDAKAAANLAKHKVSFERAREAFGDGFAVEYEDDRADYGEDRTVLLGMVGDRLLAVTYTLRGERVRIISAREAELHERRQYHEENGHE